MPDGLILIAIIGGFAFVVIAGAKIGAGAPHSLVGLYPPQGGRDWPIGVQEGDVPRFRLSPGPVAQPTIVESTKAVPAARRQHLVAQVHGYHPAR
jgi:hypothetical protein